MTTPTTAITLTPNKNKPSSLVKESRIEEGNTLALSGVIRKGSLPIINDAVYGLDVPTNQSSKNSSKLSGIKDLSNKKRVLEPIQHNEANEKSPNVKRKFRLSVESGQFLSENKNSNDPYNDDGIQNPKRINRSIEYSGFKNKRNLSETALKSSSQQHHQQQHDEALYNYSSNNNLALLYIADDYLRKTTTNDLPFKTFNELSKTNYNPDSAKLKKLLRDQEKIKLENQKGPIVTDELTEKKEYVPIVRSVSLIKQQLDYNKNQEIFYINKIDNYLKDLYEPVKLKEKEEHDKILKMPKVKVLPSRRYLRGGIFAFDTTTSNANNANKDEENLLTSSGKDGPIKEKQKSKEEKANSIIERMDLNIIYRFFWLEPYEKSEWRPDVRENASFTSIGKYIILYGGISNTILDDICSFDPARQSWIKLTQSGDVPLFGRHGHTSCEYNKNLVVFGGERRYNHTIKQRECLNDLRTFNLETCEWTIIKSLGKIIDPRRNHAAVVYDKSMFVYGGINNQGLYLKDIWALSFKNNSWTQINVENSDEDIPIAFHTMNNVQIDKNNPLFKEKKKLYPEGQYVFGGKDHTDKALNTLKILRYESKTYSWYFPEIKGNPPLPRYKHTSVFYEPLGILLIHGGRNDTLRMDSDNFCLSDICILSLEYMQWTKVTAHGHTPNIPRCAHNAVLYNNSMLLIFGGFNGIELCGSTVRYIELNQSIVKAKLNLSSAFYKELDIDDGRYDLKDMETFTKHHITQREKELSERERYMKYELTKQVIKDKMNEIIELDNMIPIKDDKEDHKYNRKRHRVLSNIVTSSTTLMKNTPKSLEKAVRRYSPQKDNAQYVRKGSLPVEY